MIKQKEIFIITSLLIFFLIGIVFYACNIKGDSSVSEEPPMPENKQNKNWELVQACSDEFNGDKLDKAKWNNDYNDWGQWSWEPYNAFVEDSVLHIRMEYKPHTRDGQKLWYKSGIVRSYESIKYGYFEARVKGASKFPGVCPAFWAKGHKNGESAEIDFMEIQEVQNNIHQIDCNLHAHPIINGERKEIHQRRHWIADWDPRDDFHIYGCEWNKDSIKWFIDGKHVLSAPNKYWDLPMDVMASMAIRPPLRIYTEDGARTNPEASTPEGFPTEMLVDYIRVWKEKQ